MVFFYSLKLLLPFFSRDKPGKGVWSEEQEEELRRLYMENQSNPETDQGKTEPYCFALNLLL